MADVLTKPLSMDHARTVFGRFEKSKTAATPPSGPDTDLLASLGPEFARTIRRRLEAELTEGFDTLRSPIDIGTADRLDRMGLAQLAHTLVGTASVGGLDAVGTTLRELEKRAADATPADLLGLVDQASRAFFGTGSAS